MLKRQGWILPSQVSTRHGFLAADEVLLFRWQEIDIKVVDSRFHCSPSFSSRLKPTHIQASYIVFGEALLTAIPPVV